MGYHWNWGILLSPVPTGETTYLGWLLAGLKMTLLVSIPAWLLALAIGTFMGILRTVPSRFLRGVATVYVAVLRNIPLIVQLFIWYHVVPEIVPGGQAFKQIDLPTQAFVACLVSLTLFTSARVCEQVRAGIQSLPPGQKQAALALGLTLPQAYRHVLVPLAARRIVPTLTSETANIVKNSAVCSTLGLFELLAENQQVVDYTAQAYEPTITVTLLYLAINGLIILLMRQVERRTRVSGFIGSAP
jgi:glutamate/aspartate transport system permease protein